MDDSLSLAELRGERVSTADIEAAPSTLIRNYLRAYTTPIAQLTDDQLRVLTSQDGPTVELAERVIARIETEPLLEACMYPGDLLCALLRPRPAFWAAHPRLLERVLDVLLAQRAALVNEGHHLVEALRLFEDSVIALVVENAPLAALKAGP